MVEAVLEVEEVVGVVHEEGEGFEEGEVEVEEDLYLTVLG